VDVTEVPPGAYRLLLTLNASGRLPESNLFDNTLEVPVVVPERHCSGHLCAGECCPLGVPCSGGRCPRPDLMVDETMLRASAEVVERMVFPGECVLTEGCVTAAGLRRLLRFDASIGNVGLVDLHLGSPESHPGFVYSPCHGHAHFEGFATYRLLTSDGTTVLTGRKQAFCLSDSRPIAPGAAAARYTCADQGISRGWADDYLRSLDCQWIDVTDVEPGRYVLEVVVNPEAHLEEARLDNNLARAEVDL
jgi:hypothetical protein